MRPRIRRLALPALVAMVVFLGGVAGVVAQPAYAGTVSAGLQGPWVPSSVSAGKLFGITGTIDKAAATGPIRILFYQKIHGSWVLQKTEYAKWSGYTATTTKYVLDATVPYAGEWRIGASYGGNAVYASDYRYHNFMVAPSASANLMGPWVPSSVSAGKPFGITGTINKPAATGPIRILFYQKIRGSWVLQKTEYAKWSGWTATTTKYVLDTTVPHAGEWRIGASYGGNAVYASDYRYHNFMVAPSASANLMGPWVPSSVSVGKPFGITGTIDKPAATGSIRILFYQKVEGAWVLQKTEYAKWSGWTATSTKYVLDATLLCPGEWRIGASYGGNAVYESDYRYQNFMVGMK